MKKKYRVRPGVRYGANGRFKPGDIVELTDAEYSGQSDRLELVTDSVEQPDTEQEEEIHPLKTIATLEEFLGSYPDASTVRDLLDEESSGKARATALTLLQNYLEVESDE